ncbi:hypothetical protein M8J77_021916 [Diaphorina citri]|nr:hypothetical protein M8J77_021916 [Diaphorina citri]
MLSILFVIYYLVKYNRRAPLPEVPPVRNEDQEVAPPNYVSSKSFPPSQRTERGKQLFHKSFSILRKNLLLGKMSAATLPELSEILPASGEGDGDDLPLPVNPIIRRRSSSKTHTRHYRIRLPPNPRRAKSLYIPGIVIGGDDVTGSGCDVEEGSGESG